MRIDRNLFSYEMPTKIIYGTGAVVMAGQEIQRLGANKVLLTTDQGIKGAGLLNPVTSALAKAGIDWVVYDQVEADSDVNIVAEATSMAQENQCNCVLGIGGGSSMDTAKAVAVMSTNPGSIYDYVGLDQVKNDPLPIVAIPTTAGTGSEVTIWAVISDKKKQLKTGIGSIKMMPDLAICDPELTLSLPPLLTAETGMDALTHAIESYVNTATQPISEALAEKSIKMIAEHLRLAVANGEDIEARDGMLMGSLTAALAFNETRLGIAHAWSSPLGAYFSISHGLANAILLPNVMEFNLIGAPDKYAKIADLMGENISGLSIMEAAAKSVEAVRKLLIDIELPRHFRAIIDIEEEDIIKLAEEALKSGNNLVNPHRPDLDDLIAICKKSL
ncbi:MAG: iron-containing alcohol dehydrogenase [Halanaerobiales bacterium]|nr:iron-containing alcohol dehydrogenase [Halanaerobiales bacterium]